LPEKTAEAFRGAYCTVGDMARRDPDGYYYLADRKSNMIISGGENVYPSEVEQVLGSHPKVKDLAVIGVPHEKWGRGRALLCRCRPNRQRVMLSITRLYISATLRLFGDGAELERLMSRWKHGVNQAHRIQNSCTKISTPVVSFGPCPTNPRRISKICWREKIRSFSAGATYGQAYSERFGTVLPE